MTSWSTLSREMGVDLSMSMLSRVLLTYSVCSGCKVMNEYQSIYVQHGCHGPEYMTPRVSAIALSYTSRSDLLNFSASVRLSDAMEGCAVPVSYARHGERF
jgi:hypothetical protein